MKAFLPVALLSLSFAIITEPAVWRSPPAAPSPPFVQGATGPCDIYIRATPSETLRWMGPGGRVAARGIGDTFGLALADGESDAALQMELSLLIDPLRSELRPEREFAWGGEYEAWRAEPGIEEWVAEQEPPTMEGREEALETRAWVFEGGEWRRRE